jgi:hypothetical protein
MSRTAASSDLRVLVRRIELDRLLQLDQRPLEDPGVAVLLALLEVGLRRLRPGRAAGRLVAMLPGSCSTASM